MIKFIILGLGVSITYTTVIHQDLKQELDSQNLSIDVAKCEAIRQSQTEQQHLREEMYLLLNIQRDSLGLVPLVVPEIDLINCS